MLLKDLTKHTWTDHQDYNHLLESSTKIEQLAGYLNDKKRQAENISDLIEIQNIISGKNVPVC
jgi:hypothetical protein